MLGHSTDERKSVIVSEFYIYAENLMAFPRQNMLETLRFSAADTRKLCESALDGLIELT